MVKFNTDILEPQNIAEPLIKKPSLSSAQQHVSTIKQASLLHSPAAEEAIISIKHRDIAVMTRQLGTLLEGDVPIVEALDTLSEHYQGQSLKIIIDIIRTNIKSGSQFSEAIALFPTLFTKLYIAMVHAGQESSTLDKVLLKIADIMDNQHHLKQQIIAAITYPLTMGIMGVGVVIFLLSIVIPKISDIFLEMDQTLPLITRVLINTSQFVQSWFWLIGIVIIGFAIGIKYYLDSPDGKYKWDKFKLNMPIIGNFLLKIESIRFVRTLAIMLTSGMTITKALPIVKEVLQNTYIAQKIKDLQNDIASGITTSQSMKNLSIFPPIMVHTIAVGEQSGHIENGLQNIAKAYEKEIESETKTITSLLEPFILIAMGTLVGFIVLAMLMPIFEINQAF